MNEEVARIANWITWYDLRGDQGQDLRALWNERHGEVPDDVWNAAEQAAYLGIENVRQFDYRRSDAKLVNYMALPAGNNGFVTVRVLVTFDVLDSAGNVVGQRSGMYILDQVSVQNRKSDVLALAVQYVEGLYPDDRYGRIAEVDVVPGIYF